MKKEIIFVRPHGRFKIGDTTTLPANQAKVLIALRRAEYYDAKVIEQSPVIKQVTPPPPPQLPKAPYVDGEVSPDLPKAPPLPEVKPATADAPKRNRGKKNENTESGE